MIEQAVFTSARTASHSGYHVVAASSQLAAEDRNDLAVWGPAHDCLTADALDAGSYNGHWLPSGAFCLGHTVIAGQEYSGRGPRFYTHCLVLSESDMRRFGNDPFRVIEAAQAACRFRPADEVPPSLPQIALPGRAPAVDTRLLRAMSREYPARQIALWVQTALEATRIGLRVEGEPQRRRWCATLFSLLPVELRPALTFTTGLRISQRRPYQIVGLPGDTREIRRFQRAADATVFDPSQLSDAPLRHPWAQLVEQVISTGRIGRLADLLSEPRPGLSQEDLPNLAGVLHVQSTGRAHERRSGSPADDARATSNGAAPITKGAPTGVAHHGTGPGGARPRTMGRNGHGKLDSAQQQTVQQLDLLDDLVGAALEGAPDARAALEMLWPQAKAQLPADVIEESRERYLRYALSFWRGNGQRAPVSAPGRSESALILLSILFEA